MAIINFIKVSGKEEKTNAVSIARIEKDIEAQRTSNRTLREETQTEIKHLQNDIHEIKSTQKDMGKIQSDMSGDIKSILSILKK